MINLSTSGFLTYFPQNQDSINWASVGHSNTFAQIFFSSISERDEPYREGQLGKFEELTLQRHKITKVNRFVARPEKDVPDT